MEQHRIERLGHRGDGIAPGPVFAARTLPGETVAGAVEGGRIAQPRILSPSPHRVAPPCRHYRSCGGCALQHAEDGFVAEWKLDVVRQALAAQGLPAPIRRLHTSPGQSRRRAVLAGRRTKSGALLGFHGRASDTITAIPDCRLLHPDLMAALPALEGLIAQVASRKGALSLTVTRSEAGLDLAVTGGREADRDLRAALAGWAAEADVARLSWNGETIVQARAPYQRMGRARVVPPPDAFLQATAEGEAALRVSVSEALAGAGRVADLFSGCGTFALPLAAEAEILAVEGDSAMLAALDDGWRGAPGLHRVATERRDLFRRPLLPDELARHDGICIDPPRAGAEAQSAALAAASPARIAFVSCNPVTFARDARLLIGGGYRLDWIDVVDQFRWSPHVELAAAFRR